MITTFKLQDEENTTPEVEGEETEETSEVEETSGE